MRFSEEQKDYMIHALEHCEILTGGRSSGKTLELIKQLNKENTLLHSIIKEVREYKKQLLFDLNRQYITFEKWEEILDPIDYILDKEK